jgi:pimeloyl-ACP methyl ester carboxylesterase
MATARVGDIDIYYEEHGDAAGEAVLLIMGFGANAAAWAPQIPALVEAGYRVIAFDNRGAGRTTQPEGPYTIPQMADDAVGLLDAIGVAGAVHVVGASMGGMIAQEFVLRHPSRVRTLTLMCTSPGGPKSFGYTEMVEMSKQVDEVKDLSEMMTPERMQEGIDVMFTPEFMKAPDEGFQAMIMSSVMHPSTLAGVKGQMAAVLAHDTYDRLGDIRVPVFVTAGEDDTLVDARNSPLLAERIKGARLKMFAGLRHGFTAEQPEAVNAALVEFLASANEQPAAAGGIIERIKGWLGLSAGQSVSRSAS